MSDIKSLRLDYLGAKQTVVHIGDTRVLVSYNSIIAVIENGKVQLGKDWAYSKTTSKYRSSFLNETTAETRVKLINGEYTLL